MTTAGLHTWRHDPAPATRIAVAGALLAAAALEAVVSVAYHAPLAVTAALCAAALIVAAARGNETAISCVLAFTLFFPNLNFRQREIAHVGLDWQNASKLLLWTVLLLIAAANWRRLVPLFRRPPLALPSLYAVIALASSGWSAVPAYTFGSAVGLFAYLGFAAVLAACVAEEHLLRVMAWTLGVYVLAGVIGGLVLPDLTWLRPSVEETSDRLAGFSGHPNVFAQQIGVALTILILARRARAMGPAPFSCLIAICAIALLLTGSRTTMAAVVAASGIVALRARRLLLPALMAALGIASMVAFAASVGALSGLPALLGDVSRTGSSSELLTLTGRTELWNAASLLIGEHPLLGWGYNGTEALIANSVPRSFAGNPVNAHNMLLQSLLSVGFLGSVPGFAYLLLLLALLFLQPDPQRDQVTIFILIFGMAEADLFATPVLLTLTAYWILAREAAKRRGPAAAPRICAREAVR
jgi:O-antigen ligase